MTAVAQKMSRARSFLIDAAFHTMEEVNEVARATGVRRGHYRQLGKGPITSRWRSLHLGPSSLVSHRVNNHVHARVAPPEGCVALAITSADRVLVDGAEFEDHQVLVTDGEIDVVVPDEASCDTLTLPRLEFESSARALFPRTSTSGELCHLMRGPRPGWAALQVEIRNRLRDGIITSESVSHLLCRFFDLMQGGTEKRAGATCLRNGSPRRVARLAQEYIEDHYAGPIRMEDVCRSTGASLRTLQRSFSRYFQTSPLQYIKVRRLNAARQALVTGDPARDSVSQIALDNGFTHFGRFSVDYRIHFAESPRATLARRASSKVRP